MIPKHIAYIPNSLRSETIIYNQQENTRNSSTMIGLFYVLLDAKVYTYINISLLFRMLLLIPTDSIINSSGN